MKECYTSIDKEEKHVIFERRSFSYAAHIPERRLNSGRGSMFRIIKHGHDKRVLIKKTDNLPNR